MSYPIAELECIEPGIAIKLKSIGIRTTGRLLERANDAKGRRLLSEKVGIEEKKLLRIANMADRMRIKGVGQEYAELLEAAGVNTIRELQFRNPANLAARMAAANRQRKLVRLLPSEKRIGRWIDEAKSLQLKISY
jgi:hypothetical protein